MAEPDGRTLAQIEADLSEASLKLQAAMVAASQASRLETIARNNVNSLQKELDVKVEALKNEAPRDTDWTRRRKDMVVGRD